MALIDQIHAIRAQRAPLAKLERYINGDHWLDSEGWSGPKPDPTDLGAKK